MVLITTSCAIDFIHNLKFSTNPNPEKSKTKGIIFSKKQCDKVNVAPIILCNDPLPWRDNLKLLGNIIESDNSMKTDCYRKRCRFIGNAHSLNQEFCFSSPAIKKKLLNIYATSFYGSSLYKLYSDQCDRLYHAYNICVRDTFSVPRTTHKYLIETISECIHPKVMIFSRFVKYVQSMLKSSKPAIFLLVNLVKDNNGTVCGKNLSKIAKSCHSSNEKLTSKLVNQKMKYSPIPQAELWRENILTEMLLYRNCDFVQIDHFLKNEINDIRGH